MESVPVQVYSQRLGPITADQFQVALDRFDLGTFVRAAPVVGGLFGQNIFVTSTMGEHVLRGCPHYPWQFPTERYFARLLHERCGIPTPWPYRIDPSTEVFGWSYVLMPRMPGVQLGDPHIGRHLPRPDRLAIARALGENLSGMQTLSWPAAGRYEAEVDTIVPFPGGGASWVVSTVRDLVARSRRHNDRTTAADVKWVEALIGRAAAALAVPVVPCFVMGDYKEGNLTVQRHGTDWRVSGVFDLMEGCVADGEMDLCRQAAAYLDEDAALARAFVDAYLAPKPPRLGLCERLAVYLLRDRLLVWEYFQRPDHAPFWDPRLTLRQWAEPYLLAFVALLTPWAAEPG
jgi:aminoglycoside phosphotransferase (APT) family kinase protein